MLRKMSNNILKDRINNDCIHEKLKVTVIEDKMRELIKMIWMRAMSYNVDHNKYMS